MRCPYCGGEVKTDAGAWKCESCDFVLEREIAGRQPPDEEAETLLSKKRTEVLEGFVSRKGGKFAASLEPTKDKKVALVFADRRPDGGRRDKATEFIRVESTWSGTVSIEMHGPVESKFTVNFGLVSSRMAECLGLIAAVKLVKHDAGGSCRHLKLEVSANNRLFAEYVLRERSPPQPGNAGCYRPPVEPARRIRLVEDLFRAAAEGRADRRNYEHPVPVAAVPMAFDRGGSPKVTSPCPPSKLTPSADLFWLSICSPRLHRWRANTSRMSTDGWKCIS